MKSVIFSLYLASILFSAIMAFVYRHAIKGRGMLIMLPFLVFVAVQEVGVFLYLWRNPNGSTAIVYNFYKPISVLTFLWLYYHLEFMKPVRRVMIWLTAGYLLVTAISYIFIESLHNPSNYLTLARGFVITLFGILFLFRFFNLDNATDEKYWRPLIWITVGIVIFYPVTSISINFQNYLASYDARIFGFKVYQLIPQVMSIFMYSCFSYAFYLCRKTN